MKDSYYLDTDKYNNSASQLGSKTYIIAIQGHKDLAKSKSQELEKTFHDMKFGNLSSDVNIGADFVGKFSAAGHAEDFQIYVLERP